jgi:hypothetical protein
MPDDRETPPQSPDNPFDAWLAAAPAGPAHALCPWCSARLDPPDADACPACGAQLHGDEVDAIPGVTVVDPQAARKAVAAKPSGGAGLLTWLSGDRDLVEAATSLDTPGADPHGRAAVDIGPASRDAVAPPDPRVRREMERIARGQAASDDSVDDVGDDEDAAPGPGAAPGDAADGAAPSEDVPGGPPDASTNR